MPQTKKMQLADKPHKFEIFAIASSEDDSRIIWLINNALHINLQRIENHTEIPFSCFEYKDNGENTDYILIKNKNDKESIINEISTVDYLLKISGNLTEEKIKDFLIKIRSVKEITACIKLNVKKSSKIAVFSRI